MLISEKQLFVQDAPYDNTTLSLLQARLNEQQELIESILSTTTSSIFVVDSRGTILMANALASQMFGYETLEGSPVQNLLHFPIYGDTLSALREKTELQGMGVRFDGREFPIEATLNPFQSGDGQQETIIVRDISRRKAAERHTLEMRLRQERVNLMTSFIQNISHEFKTPLSIVETASHLLTFHPDPTRRTHYQEQIHQAVERLVGLVDILLIRSRLEAGDALHLEAVDLADVLAALAESPDRHPRLTVIHDDNTPPVQADAGLLRRALGAIFLMFSSRMNQESTLGIRITSEPTGTRLSMSAPGAMNIDLAWFTDPLFRGKEHEINTMELSLAHEIIQAHGGTLTLEKLDGTTNLVIHFRS